MINYRDIKVWQRAHALTLRVYKLSVSFPPSELYSLTSQMKRAAYSIPMNIAEGCGKSTDPDLARFMDIAAGSASELDYQFLLAKDLSFINNQVYEEVSSELTEIRKMLTAFINQVRKRIPKR